MKDKPENPTKKLRQCFSEVLQKWINKETYNIHLNPCDNDYQTLIDDMVVAVNKAEYNPIVSIDSIRQVMTEVLNNHDVVEINVDELIKTKP